MSLKHTLMLAAVAAVAVGVDGTSPPQTDQSGSKGVQARPALLGAALDRPATDAPVRKLPGAGHDGAIGRSGPDDGVRAPGTRRGSGQEPELTHRR
jgi:hypothetical protein